MENIWATPANGSWGTVTRSILSGILESGFFNSHGCSPKLFAEF
jgi:hypothetical protein